MVLRRISKKKENLAYWILTKREKDASGKCHDNKSLM